MDTREYERLATLYLDCIYKVAINSCKNYADAEDVVQNTFMKLLGKENHFEDDEHARKWLIRVAMNMAGLEKREGGCPFAKRFAMVAAAIAVIFVGSNGIVYAATGSTWVSGIFRDITNWHGAVIGTEYVRATEEVGINVSEAAFDKGYVSLPVEIVFHNKDTAPFKYVEEVTLEKCEVLDEAGKVVSVNDESVTGMVKDGVVEIIIPISGQEMTANTEYTLVLESFYGQSKGDAPLEIKGTWECKFVISENN